ncbi:OmpA family protein [Dyadobacter sp. NIV53]|uniref:OmpA family protein n=1 Tax=Dyadobacter sp. NIV53 TaxID=2861765 RepID=UPI001C875457|nr:OmpA family protein [Dyadobacter sp. NIV53]
MANLDVQPKKKSFWWIWLIIALLVAAAAVFLRGCEEDQPTTVIESSDSTSGNAAITMPEWDKIDFNSPDVTFDEVTDSSISVQGNDNYTIYGLGENILFATGKSKIQDSAEVQLKQISGSIKKRFNGIQVAVYGNTDNTGNTNKNKKLAEDRAEVVKNWLVKNTDLTDQEITIRSKGESDPSSFQCNAGRKENEPQGGNRGGETAISNKDILIIKTWLTLCFMQVINQVLFYKNIT